MKVTLKEVKKEFQPFEVGLIVETEEELEALIFELRGAHSSSLSHQLYKTLLTQSTQKNESNN